MRKLRRGVVPLRLIPFAARLCVIGVVGVVVGGCATNKQPSYVNAPMADPRPAPAAATHKVDIEDDGLPAQVPPASRHPALPDDPTEPWSPNYGGPAPANSEPRTPEPKQPRPGHKPRRQETAAAIPAPLPAPHEATAPLSGATRGRVQISNAGSDDIMARAIAAHEMRRW